MSNQSVAVDSDDSEQDTNATIEEHRKPRCSPGHRRDTADWHEETVDETTLVFRDFCSWCFPDDEPDVGDQVVRVRSQFGGGFVHLPGDVYAERHGEDDGDGE